MNDVKNARRIELAEKKSRGLLSEAEQVEFDALQKETFDVLDAQNPRKEFDVDSIEERLRDKESGGF